MAKLVGMGRRKRVKLWDQNWYLTVTKTSVDITVPFENRPEQLDLRLTVERLCSEISELMVLNEEKS